MSGHVPCRPGLGFSDPQKADKETSPTSLVEYFPKAGYGCWEEGQPLQPQFKLPELLLGQKYPEMISFSVSDGSLNYSIQGMIRAKLKGFCPKRSEPARSHRIRSIPTWEERHLMILSPHTQHQTASTQVTVMPNAWAHWLSRCISPCFQSSRHLHTRWRQCIYCVCTALTVSWFHITFLILWWQLFPSDGTFSVGEWLLWEEQLWGVSSHLAGLRCAAGARGGISQLWITCKGIARERMLHGSNATALLLVLHCHLLVVS